MTSTLTLATPYLFSQLNQHAQDIIVGNIIDYAQTWPSWFGFLQALLEANSLTPRQQKRFSEAINMVSLDAAASHGLCPSLFFSKLIRSFKSHSWPSQKPAVRFLKQLLSEGIEHLDEEQQKELGNNLLQTADGKCWNAVDLLKELPSMECDPPPAFIEGIIEECLFNEGGQIRFKPDQSKLAFRTISCLEANAQNQLVKSIIATLKNNEPKRKGVFAQNPRDQLVFDLSRLVESDPDRFSVLTPIQTALEKLDLNEDV